MKHILSIQNPPDCPTFDYIRTGAKKVEGRKYSPKYSAGDIIVFRYEDKEFSTIVRCVRKYKSLEDYLRTEGFANVLPGVGNFDKAIEIYNRWSTPAQRDQLLKNYGWAFIAIEIL